MNSKLDSMPRPMPRESALTDDDRILYLMDDISRGARRAYDARIGKIGLNQTQWRIIGQLLREPLLMQSEIAKRLELESATIGQAVAGLCAKGLMERQRATTDRRAWQLILTEQIDKLLPELRESADRLHDLLWRNTTLEEKRTLREILVRASLNLDQGRIDSG